MGNLCGKESSDPFASPGPTLNSAPTSNPNGRTSVPQNKKPKITGPGRTLGGGDTAGTGGTVRTDGAAGNANEARRQAALAAEERAKVKQPKGKLGSQLAQQQKQTRTDTLDAASAEERRRRDLDANAEVRDYN